MEDSEGNTGARRAFICDFGVVRAYINDSLPCEFTSLDVTQYY